MLRCEFQNVKLRQWYLSDDDIEAFRQLVRRADHSLTDGFLPEYYTEGCEYRWIKGMVDSMVFGDELHYAVDVNGKAVGCVNVSRGGGDYRHTVVLRLVLLPEVCGHGIGTEAVTLVVNDIRRDYFDKDFVYKGSIERIEARVYGANIAAERVLKKNCFVYEGTLRNAVSKDGKRFDQKVFGYVFRDHYFPDAVSMSEDKVERIRKIHEILQNA